MDDDMDDMADEFDLVYSDDEEEAPDVALENEYYNSKSLKGDNPQQALASFARVGF
jgi:COP9 signalosome complex subunit 2